MNFFVSLYFQTDEAVKKARLLLEYSEEFVRVPREFVGKFPEKSPKRLVKVADELSWQRSIKSSTIVCTSCARFLSFRRAHFLFFFPHSFCVLCFFFRISPSGEF